MIDEGGLEQAKAAALSLLAERGPGKTICPSEIARAIAPGEKEEDWRAEMDTAHAAACALQDAGKVALTQGGERHTGDGRPKGAYRLKRI